MKSIAEKFTAVIKRYNNILIFIKGSPDPDAIASSYAFKMICEAFGIKSSIIAAVNLSLPQNREFVKVLKIPIKFEKSLSGIEDFDSYAVFDHQSLYVDKLTYKIPCAVHIDHHDFDEEEEREKIDVDFKLINREAGSTSTILALLLKELNLSLEEDIMKNISTALQFGIENDTDNYSHAGKIDYDALNYISEFSDNRIINRINGVPLSNKALKLLGQAIDNQFIYKDWLIAGLGYIDQRNRDLIAIVADFLIKRQDISTVIVFAIIEKEDSSLYLDASFRTNSENINLNSIIKEITLRGGGRKYKGAFQVGLDYFANCPDRELLWKLVKITTVEVLKKRRDRIYVTELRGFYKNFKRRIFGFFRENKDK